MRHSGSIASLDLQSASGFYIILRALKLVRSPNIVNETCRPLTAGGVELKAAQATAQREVHYRLTYSTNSVQIARVTDVLSKQPSVGFLAAAFLTATELGLDVYSTVRIAMKTDVFNEWLQLSRMFLGCDSGMPRLRSENVGL